MVVFACGLLVQSFFLTEDRHWAGDWRWRHPVTCSKSAIILSRAPSLPSSCHVLQVCHHPVTCSTSAMLPVASLWSLCMLPCCWRKTWGQRQLSDRPGHVSIQCLVWKASTIKAILNAELLQYLHFYAKTMCRFFNMCSVDFFLLIMSCTSCTYMLLLHVKRHSFLSTAELWHHHLRQCSSWRYVWIVWSLRFCILDTFVRWINILTELMTRSFGTKGTAWSM